MSRPFETNRADGVTMHEIIARMVSEREPGDVLSYERLAAELTDGGVIPDRRQVQAAVRRADRLLEAMGRVLSPVPNVGYVIDHPAEHVRIAGRHRRKAVRALGREVSTLERTNLDELDASQRTRHLDEQRRASGVYGAVRLSERRHLEIEAAIRSRTAEPRVG